MSGAEACSCGSGLAFALCHGDPRNEYAREQALREAEAVAILFPSVRVRGVAAEAVVARARSVAWSAGGDVPNALLDGVLELVDPDEWRRVVDSWAEPYADRWKSLTTAAGDPIAAERELVTGALRVAFAEAAPTPTELVAPLEGGALSRSPFAALAVVLPPTSVWSHDEASAGAAAAGGRRKVRDRHAAIEAVAHGLVSFEHVRRVRLLAARLAADLPCEGPRASELLADVCRRIELDVGAARAAAAALLVAYVESESYITSPN